ncbi:MAG: ADP-ribose pyrophosphatase [Pyrinomonas sp.]|uniref:NUDIX hydrolase n=1 Tax=Pyrinomonas sp. TaxID=2080306 RepID=UPI003317FF36
MREPEMLSSEEIYKGRIFAVRVDMVREGDRTHAREVVHHPGSAAIVALFDDDTVALVRQYRHPAVKFMLEIPAGSRDEGETPEACAARELEEELGYVATQMEKLAEFFVSPGFCTEKMWVYLATSLRETKQNPEEDEEFEIARVPLRRALQMISTGEIEDAKTIIGLLLTAARRGLSNF